MATKVLMEALSPTMEEGRLVEWKKQEGEKVAAGDVLAEVETDKAIMDLIARASGTLLKQVAAAGTTLPVSSLVGVIGEVGEDLSVIVGGGPAGRRAGGQTATNQPPAPNPHSAPPPAATTPSRALTAAPPPGPVAGRIKASPLAKRIAADRGLDLGGVHGTGPDGRIVQRDVESAPVSARVTPGTPLPARPPARLPGGTPFTDTPLTQIRKTIAKRLAQSIGPVPTFYLTAEVDMERTWEAREDLNGADRRTAGPPDRPKISFNDIIIKATAIALRQHPACNAWWQDDFIRYWNEVHVSMAVAVEDGLITPIIRHADQKSLREISAESHDLAARARERRLKPEEYTGGTFSVSNLGMFDIDQFTAVINPPEAGILAIGAITAKAVVTGQAVMVRRRMRVTMSCDHRVIDGTTGAGFLKTFKTLLENPLAMVW